MAFHYLDTYWMVMPEYHVIGGLHVTAISIIVDIAALIGVGGVFVSCLVRSMAPYNLVPIGDPRLPECLAFQNI
jgi:hypothetical protein